MWTGDGEDHAQVYFTDRSQDHNLKVSRILRGHLVQSLKYSDEKTDLSDMPKWTQLLHHRMKLEPCFPQFLAQDFVQLLHWWGSGHFTRFTCLSVRDQGSIVLTLVLFFCRLEIHACVWKSPGSTLGTLCWILSRRSKIWPFRRQSRENMWETRDNNGVKWDSGIDQCRKCGHLSFTIPQR